MIRPQRLNKGDTIGVIAPAGIPNEQQLKKGITFLEQLGLKVKVGKYINEVNGYLAGTDEQRLSDLHDMIKDETIKAIICARGGYGTGRLVSDIDYDLIKHNPKIIWGYSDITYLHTAIRQMTGLITFHGPMVSSELAKDDFDNVSANLFNQLFEPTTLHYSSELGPLEILSAGKATGPLVGGNLSLITRTIGTPYEINTKGKIILIEDVNEEPYQVDSMLNQLRLSGKISDAKGIVIGDFSANDPMSKEEYRLLNEVFHHYFSTFVGPVLSGFKIGHCLPHFSVPLGAEAAICTKNKSFTIQPGVR